MLCLILQSGCFIVEVQRPVIPDVLPVLPFVPYIDAPCKTIFQGVIYLVGVLTLLKCEIQKCYVFRDMRRYHVKTVVNPRYAECANLHNRLRKQPVQAGIDVTKKARNILPIKVIYIEHLGIAQQCNQLAANHHALTCPIIQNHNAPDLSIRIRFPLAVIPGLPQITLKMRMVQRNVLVEVYRINQRWDHLPFETSNAWIARCCFGICTYYSASSKRPPYAHESADAASHSA